MKKVITLSMIVLLAFNASAQFTKGNKVLGLGFNFQTSKQETDAPTSFNRIEQSVQFSTELGFATKENRISGFFQVRGSRKINMKYLLSLLQILPVKVTV